MQPPDYAGAGLLSDIVPAAAVALGAGNILEDRQRVRAHRVGLDTETRVVVVALIDGMGLELLKASWAYAPFLRSVRDSVREFSAGFPSTTANSLSSLGTGLLPGGHGVMGYKLKDPETDDVFNQLTWNTTRDPHTWVPDATLFERLHGNGVDVVSLGEPKFVGRGLNAASLRGGTFRGSHQFDQRVQHAVEEAKKPGQRLIYFYWGALDKTGHGKGTDSHAWTAELEAVDAGLARLANSLPSDAQLLITADHGMVNVDYDARIDLADHPEVCELVSAVGGEPRATHLYTPRPQETASAINEIGAGRVHAMLRNQAVADGWFGPVRTQNLGRIGDVVVISEAGTAIVDSRSDSPSALKLRGHHGGITADELAIPLIVLRP